ASLLTQPGLTGDRNQVSVALVGNASLSMISSDLRTQVRSRHKARKLFAHIPNLPTNSSARFRTSLHEFLTAPMRVPDRPLRPTPPAQYSLSNIPHKS